MGAEQGEGLSDERRAMLGLWSVPGIGMGALEVIRCRFGEFAQLIDQPVARWSKGLDLAKPALEGLAQVERLDALADAVVERARRAQFGIAFRGDPAYPSRLAEVTGAPPLLFFRGPPCTARPRVAMVGSRSVSSRQEEVAMGFADQVARYGIGIVSGAADGIDTACHMGALNARGETWAFLGSALDVIDAGARAVHDRVLPRGGSVYSEFPPGAKASRGTFPRRNRLISGSADVVLVLRAKQGSGALHTVKYALRQGRPVLAVPGDVGDATAEGVNALIRDGAAAACLRPEDVLKALKLDALARSAPPPAQAVPVQWGDVSAEARQVFDHVQREPLTFEDVLAAAKMPSAALASALCELELLGLVVQRPGKRYEKV
jgi:DNA protecting protein DprA